MSFGLIFIFIFVFLVLYPVTLIRSRRSNSTCSMMVINKKNSMLVKIMCCGEEITNQINCLFLFYFWCGRKKVKREKKIRFFGFFGAEVFRPPRSEIFRGRGTRNFVFSLFLFLWWNQTKENVGTRQRRVASCS